MKGTIYHTFSLMKENDGVMDQAASFNYVDKANKNNNTRNKAKTGKKVSFDPKAIAGLKINSNVNMISENPSLEEPRKVTNDIGSMMTLAGFNGNCYNVSNSGFGGIQAKLNNQVGFQFQGPSPLGTIPNGDVLTTHHQYQSSYSSSSSFLMSMNGFNSNNHPSSLTMGMKQQPQMMYQRAPLVHPNTGYFWNNGYNYKIDDVNYSAAIDKYFYNVELPNYSGEDHHYAADMFSDDSTNINCSFI